MRGFTQRLPGPLLGVALLGRAVGACDQQESPSGEATAQRSALVQDLTPGKLRQEAIAWLETRVPAHRPATGGAALHRNQEVLQDVITQLKGSVRESDEPGAAAADAVTQARL